MFGSVGEVLDALDEALDAVAGLDPLTLDTREIGEWAVALQERLARLDAAATHAVGAFDAAGDVENARSSAAWLAYRCRLPRWLAKRSIANARALRRMPEVDAAFSRGELCSEHVRALAAARAMNPEAFAKAEDELVDAARCRRFDGFQRRVAYWRQEAEPDRVEDDAEAAFEARHAHASTSFEDRVVVDATLDPVGGRIWLAELRRLEQQLFEGDWADAKAFHGRDPLVSELERTPAQRRADAMVLMAERSAAMPEAATMARPLINVLVGYETFAGRICELADGTVLTPGQVVALLHDADVRRVVFDGPSRVIDVGVRQRLFTGATRVAVELRDLECQADPSCDVRYPDCEADHLQPHAWGGDTVQANGGLKCSWHHRRRRPPPH